MRNKVPVRVAAGLANPELAYRGIAATERRLRRALTLPANATASQRLDFVEQRLGELVLADAANVRVRGGRAVDAGRVSPFAA